MLCSDCRKAAAVEPCRATQQHKGANASTCGLCRSCFDRTKARAARDPGFYRQYEGWCDACVWFDMG